MAIKIAVKTASVPTATISKENKTSAGTTKSQVTEIPTIKAPVNATGDQWCTVGFEAGLTQNLGDYESARIGVTLAIPCPHQEIDEVFNLAQEWVNTRMLQMQEELPDKIGD